MTLCCAYKLCGKPLVLRDNETVSNFRRRFHCDRFCAQRAHAAFVRPAGSDDATRLTVYLPPRERARIHQIARSGQFASTTEYIRHLVREDMLQRRLDAAFAADPALRRAA